MILKEVKVYGKNNRLRIDINKSDNLTPGAEVVILTSTEFEDMEAKLTEMESRILRLNKDNEIYKSRIDILSNQEQNQEQNLKEIIQDVTSPIYETYQKQLESKDNEIKQLQMQLKTLQAKTNQYNLDMMSLNALDILIRSKHKQLIQNFNTEISILASDPDVVDADTIALPGENTDLEE